MGSGGSNDQHYCLRWNNFHSNIATSFEQLRDHEDFVDVTLACEGGTIKAHKVVLSACSPYFRSLLTQNPCKHPIIILRDVALVDVHALLSFVYQGEVYVSQDRLTAFLHTAELLHIKGLTDQHHTSTTHSGPVSSSSSSIAVSLLATPHADNSCLTHLVAKEPQPPSQQSPLHVTRTGLRTPSPTRPPSTPSPPPPPPPQYVTGPSLHSHHISPPPKKRRQMHSSSTPVSTGPPLISPLSTSSSSSASSLGIVGSDPQSSLTPPNLATDNPPPPLAAPKLEAGASLLSGSTLAAALTAPRGESSASVVSQPPPLLLPVEVKQEAVESPTLLEDSQLSVVEQQGAVNLVVEQSGSPAPPSILRQRIQGYQGSPDAPPPPSSFEDSGVEGGDSKESLNPAAAVAIIRRQQHMLGLAAAAAADAPTAVEGALPPLVTPGRHRWRCMQPRLCPFCWKTFSNSFNLKQHVVNVHTVGQGLQCHVCNKTVKNKWYLRKHHVTAHGAPLKRNKTTRCDGPSIVSQQEVFYLNSSLDSYEQPSSPPAGLRHKSNLQVVETAADYSDLRTFGKTVNCSRVCYSEQPHNAVTSTHSLTTQSCEGVENGSALVSAFAHQHQPNLDASAAPSSSQSVAASMQPIYHGHKVV